MSINVTEKQVILESPVRSCTNITILSVISLLIDFPALEFDLEFFVCLGFLVWVDPGIELISNDRVAIVRGLHDVGVGTDFNLAPLVVGLAVIGILDVFLSETDCDLFLFVTLEVWEFLVGYDLERSNGAKEEGEKSEFDRH